MIVKASNQSSHGLSEAELKSLRRKGFPSSYAVPQKFIDAGITLEMVEAGIEAFDRVSQLECPVFGRSENQTALSVIYVYLCMERIRQRNGAPVDSECIVVSAQKPKGRLDYSPPKLLP